MKLSLKSSVSAAVLTLFLSAPGFAADVFHKGGMKDETGAPVAAETETARSWTGLWLGAVGGYQFSNSVLTDHYDESYKGESFYSSNAKIDGLGGDGLFGELQLGFDRQIGSRVVLGIFGGVNLSDAEFKISASAGSPSGSDSASIKFGQEWGGVLGPRIGYLVSPNTMLYGAGGWAFGEMEKIHYSGPGGSGDVFEHQDTDLSGWFGEVGLETRMKDLGDNIYLNVAGRYTKYGAMTLNKFSDENGDCVESGNTKLTPKNLDIMVGLKAKLGGFERLGY